MVSADLLPNFKKDKKNFPKSPTFIKLKIKTRIFTHLLRYLLEIHHENFIRSIPR